MNRAVFKYIEHELYNYEDTKKAIEELREDIIESAGLKEVPGGCGISDITARKGIKLVSNKVLCRMVNTTAAIDRALARLDDSHRQLFELKYKQGLSWENVCIEMPTSERTYFRIRRELVYMVAEQLGLFYEQT